MIRLSAERFWSLYRDEVRRCGTVLSLSTSRAWTRVAIDAAKAICLNAGLNVGNELYLDVMGYEQREPGVDFNWDLRIAFEHENSVMHWHDELCKLCHVVADLRVLVGYYASGRELERNLQQRIDLMGERMTRVADSEWLFIFGPTDSRRDRTPWSAFSINCAGRIVQFADDNPFNPHSCFASRS